MEPIGYGFYFILFYTFYYLLDILYCISEHESQLNVIYVIIILITIQVGNKTGVNT
jgi:hypothetical protein